MKLTEEIKQKIIDEYNNFLENQYGNNTMGDRKKNGQFFTPPEITITMIEMIDRESLADAKILDPTCGAGNLLVACILAGARIENCCGNELDVGIAKICRKRIRNLRDKLYEENPNDYRVLSSQTGKKVCDDTLEYRIHVGDATKPECLMSFNKGYVREIQKKYIDAFKESKENLKKINLF